MVDDGGRHWTIDELGAAVAAALADDYEGAPNGRVRDIPDRRTIRYYTTLGLLDRAVAMRGRTALYGRRHLFQLVAIKQLQARGRSLAEVQAALAGQTDTALARLAGLSWDMTQGRPTPARRAARAFWRQVPEPRPAESSQDDGSRRDPEELVRPTADHGPRTLQGLWLAEGVTLLLAPSRPLEDEDLKALRKAAAPLMNLLNRRRLISPREQGETS
jgi:DNA-binding transcriptional MerR regulator